MQCLIDSDILCYECGFAAEASWKYGHPEATPLWLFENPPPWELVQEIVDGRISSIETVCEATEESILYFTGSSNFRTELAKTTEYKARLGNKPYHYYNIKAYLKGKYVFRQVEGLEADDLLSIDQTARISERSTIICTRDKDLLSVGGLLYSWELNGQPAFGPFFIEGFGRLILSEDRKKLRGYGYKFFLGQCLSGDSVDSVPGLKGYGPVKVFNALDGIETYDEGLLKVYELYKEVYGDGAYEYLLEQGRLLHMTRELHPDGSPVLWEIGDVITKPT